MKVSVWAIGKTKDTYLEAGLEIYRQRLPHYLPFEWHILPDVKNAGKHTPDQLKVKEGEAVLRKITNQDYLVLLEERGRQYTSVEFTGLMEHYLQLPYRQIIFLIGGSFGFSQAVYHRGNAQLALSKMTFSHQMVRLFLLEQLYRAMTIVRNEGYHHF